MSSQSITLQKLALTWYAMSSSDRAMASGVDAVGWGPQATAVSRTYKIQSGPQSTSMPCHHFFRVSVKGCASPKS